MKIVLETIPVWDALKKDEECPICSLMKEAERDAVRYYLSSAIMTPEVRVETNRYGFCPHHSLILAEGGNPQSLALTMDTYYEENEKAFAPYFTSLKKSHSSFQVKKAIDGLKKAAAEREAGCLVCTRMNDRLYRYSFTISALTKEDKDFAKAFRESKGLCLHHTLKVSEVAEDALSGKELVEFQKMLFDLLERNLGRVRQDDWWMTQKYKSENADKPWNGCEDAQKRAVKKLVGEARVLDPLKDKKSKI